MVEEELGSRLKAAEAFIGRGSLFNEEGGGKKNVF